MQTHGLFTDYRFNIMLKYKAVILWKVLHHLAFLKAPGPEH